MKKYSFIIIIIITFILFFTHVSSSFAQTGACSGQVKCCYSGNIVTTYSPAGCVPGDPGCTATQTCSSPQTLPCRSTQVGTTIYCQIYDPYSTCAWDMDPGQEYCYWAAAPSPTPGVTPSPAGQSCAWCTGADQCAQSGGTWGGGQGYCSSGLQCCTVAGGGGGNNNFGCSWNVNDYGYPSCKLGPGNACEGTTCVPYGHNCTHPAYSGGPFVPNDCAGGLQHDYQGNCNCPCIPKCSPACGQPDSCGFTCSTANTVAPDVITSTTPADGGNAALNYLNQVTLTWTTPNNASQFDIELFPKYSSCSDPLAYCLYGNASNLKTNSFTFTPQVNAYTFRLRPVNAQCNANGVQGTWSSYINFTISAPITGTFYNDTLHNATLNPSTGVCQIASAPATVNAPAGTSVNATWFNGSSAGTTSGTGYSVNGLAFGGTSTVSVTPGSPWHCVCPAGCTLTGVTAPSTGKDYYISNTASSWWQALNGLIYGGNTSGLTVSSLIPGNTCIAPYCIPALAGRDTAGNASSSGIVVTGGGNINANLDPTAPLTYLNEEGRSDRVVGANFSGVREDYGYLSSLLSMGSSPTVDLSTTSLTKPTTSPANGRAYYATGDHTITSAWTVNNGEKFIIFVNGNLTISSKISVANGGFLMFITAGNITFTNALGNSSVNDPTATVAGIYVANGQLIVQGGLAGGDLRFVGDGSFVGWGGVSLGRNFNNFNTNNTSSAELFRLRPDFVINAPTILMKPKLLWQETN